MLRNGLLRYILYTCPKSIVMNLTTCTHGAHKIHSCKHKVYIQQNHSTCTDEVLGRVYRWGPWLRVKTRPLPLRPWLEPSACTCDPRKRVHSRPPDLLTGVSIINHPVWSSPIFGNIHILFSAFLDVSGCSPWQPHLEMLQQHTQTLAMSQSWSPVDDVLQVFHNKGLTKKVQV